MPSLLSSVTLPVWHQLYVALQRVCVYDQYMISFLRVSIDMRCSGKVPTTLQTRRRARFKEIPVLVVIRMLRLDTIILKQSNLPSEGIDTRVSSVQYCATMWYQHVSNTWTHFRVVFLEVH